MNNNHKVGTNPLQICSLELVRFTNITNINERYWKHKHNHKYDNHLNMMRQILNKYSRPIINVYLSVNREVDCIFIECFYIRS